MINDILSAKILWRYGTDLWLSFRISFPEIEKNWKATSIVFNFMFKFWKTILRTCLLGRGLVTSCPKGSSLLHLKAKCWHRSYCSMRSSQLVSYIPFYSHLPSEDSETIQLQLRFWFLLLSIKNGKLPLLENYQTKSFVITFHGHLSSSRLPSQVGLRHIYSVLSTQDSPTLSIIWIDDNTTTVHRCLSVT